MQPRVKELPFSTVEEAIEEFKRGRFLIVVDDEDRENEGDLVIAAEVCTPDAINFMARYGRGFICIAMEGKRLDELSIPLMTTDNTSRNTTAFTVTVDARRGTTTGISAADRAQTVRVLLDRASRPEDLARPGHINPLRYQEGGVLVRAGHTEASVDLARLANMYPAGMICEIMAEDGTMARLPELEAFGQEHGIKIISIAQLIAYRRRMERLIERVSEARLPTEGWGDFKIYTYRSTVDPNPHVAMVMGDVTTPEPVLVRIHSECLTGDVFGSQRCDCGDQLHQAMDRIKEEGRGVLLYMRQEGRGIGLHAKIQAYALQDQGMDTVEANLALGFAPDLRHYGVGAQILVDLGLHKLRLLTNNPKKVAGIDGYGLEVVEQLPIQARSNPNNVRYLQTKREKLGHLLDLDDATPAELAAE